MMEVVALLAGTAFAVNKAVSVIKALRAGDWNTPVTQTVVWVLSVLAVVLLCHAKLTSNAAVPGLAVTFGSLDGSSQILLGLIIGGTGSFTFDALKSIDNTQSNAEPPLVKPPAQAP